MNNKRITLLLSLVCVSSSMLAMTRQQVKRQLAKEYKEVEEKYGTPVYGKVVTGRGPLVPLKKRKLFRGHEHTNKITLNTFNEWVKAHNKYRQGKELKDHEKMFVGNLDRLRNYLKVQRTSREVAKRSSDAKLHEEIRKAIRSFPGRARGYAPSYRDLARSHVFRTTVSKVRKRRPEALERLERERYKPSRPPRPLKKYKK